MDLNAEISYPDASTDQAFELIVDPEFRAAVCDATHALDYDVRVDQHDDGSASVAIHRTMPADLPDFVKKLVGETVDVLLTEEWAAPGADGARSADVVVEIKGQPAKMIGTAVLEPNGDGCREVVTGTLKVAIPLLGRKIEPEIAKGIVAALAKEQEVGRSWLG